MKSSNIIKTLFIIGLLNLIFTRYANATVFINEFSSNSDPEWVELYNDSSSTVELSGWTIADEAQTPKQLNGNIPGFGYYVFENQTGWLNNTGGDRIILFNGTSVEDQVEYGKSESVVGTPSSTKSAGRVPNASNSWQNNIDPSKGSQNSTEETPAPTASATPSPSPSQATVNIAEAIDANGQVLNTVKIFIDDTYINHYAPETLTFCDGCFCNSVVCGFGNHTFRFEKSGYVSYEKSENIEFGGNYQINPVLSEEEDISETESTSPPSQSPKTPSSFSVSLPLSSTPKPQKTDIAENSDGQRVLGIQDENVEKKEEENNNESIKSSKFPTASYFFLFAGFLLLGYSGYALVKKQTKSKGAVNSSTNENSDQE